MTQDMNNEIMTQNTTVRKQHRRLTLSKRFPQANETFAPGKRNVCLRQILLLVVMLLIEVNHAWGQDYSGVYYIGSHGYNAANTTTNYYLCPTENWYYYTSTSPYYQNSPDNGQPFMTTYQCRNGVYSAENAVWIVEKQSSGYYLIKRAIDGKYLTYNDWLQAGNKGRMRLHLEATADGDNALFQITYVSGTGSSTIYDIMTKNGGPDNTNRKYLNVTGNANQGNQPSLQAATTKTDGPGNIAVGGIIGLWTSGASSDTNSRWYLEKAAVDAPTITNNFDGTFTITAETGATIYYTTDGTTPTTSTTTTATTSVNITQTESMTVIKAIAKKDGDAFPSVVTTYIIPQCAKPDITVSGGTVTITCATEGATIHYTIDGSPATSSSPTYSAPFAKGDISAIRAIATKAGYAKSNEAQILPPTEVHSSSAITDMSGNYILASDFSSSGSIGTSDYPFTGTIDGNLNTLTLSYPLVAYADGATIKNVILDNITISGSGNVGAICNEASGASRIYNCGVLSTGTTGSTVTGDDNVGSIVGLLDGTSRVINCYSYATISGGSMMGGIVGCNNQVSTMNDIKTVVVNCMFYGDITGGGYPVYGGNVIENGGTTAINNYNYYRHNSYDIETDSYVDDVTFDDAYTGITNYNRSWPAEAEYLTRYEYYRSILNSNRKLCTWWVSGTDGTAPTDEDVEDVGIAKWVLDPTIAPYPILKPWGKYYSVINQDPVNVWNPLTKQSITRTSAEPYQGKRLGTLSVTINAGDYHAGTGASTINDRDFIIMDMDTLNHDYCYGKIQLPYYNELFGDATANTSNWDKRYGGNYKDYVVTGWKITAVDKTGTNSFKADWESGYNFADRNCTDKDLFDTSGRVFAQGGYYYVPEGVTAITIEAYWGQAVYLHNSEHSLDRVSVADVSADNKDGSGDNTEANFGYAFTPAGTLANTFQGNGKTVYTSLQDAITALPLTGNSNTVYDQAIVLVGNVQVKNRGASLGRGNSNNNQDNNKPFTIMSCDLDLDNEPDYCLQLQQRNTTNRPGIHPVRFDFLPVPELGLAIRSNQFAYSIGLMVPQGHFEITETSFMYTTQFEYDADVGKYEAPLILNGGHFEQIVLRYGPKDRTSYILMGGHFRIKRFTPGYHATPNTTYKVRHCAVNAIGGEYPEFYLSGIYSPGSAVRADNPHCYTNGGKFGVMAGAGYEQVNGSVTFEIDHSIIREFYGGGINGSKPVTGSISVTIDHSLVDKYCGGPKVGPMTSGETVTTNATGTTFGVFYGGGNGGTSYYRENKKDFTSTFPKSSSGWWGFPEFNPLNQVDGVTAVYDTGTDKKGYHAEYEFEVFNSSNGLKSGEDVIRCYYNWAQFGTTTTGDVTSTLTDCTIKGNFYGGGNLANVTGNVTSTLQGDTHVYGSVFGAGYSAAIPSFRVHDKSTVRIPSKDGSGNVDEQGSLDYYQDNGKDRYYTWCYKNPTTNAVSPAGVVIPSGTTTKNNPAFQYDNDGDGVDEWYVLTTVSLENLGAVTGDVALNIGGTTIVEGDVYGGGESSNATGNSVVNVMSGTVSGDTYGGGALANVDGNTKVTLLGGTINGNVYGGGKGRLEEGTSGQAGYVSPVEATVSDATVYLNGMEKSDYDADAADGKIYENLGLVQASETGPYTVADSKKGCVVKGDIFGCNNLNGTPKGDVTVHVYATQNENASQIANAAASETQAAVTNAKVDGRYDVNAVYGGGNLAPYIPSDGNLSTAKATVIIDGCDRTSIRTVYGGGNAASTPATSVTVNGTYEINELFGGGNGLDALPDGRPNPGANVGYKNYTIYEEKDGQTVAKDDPNYDTKEKRINSSNIVYGTGAASVNIYGGNIHAVFGGSNTKGNVRISAVTLLDDQEGCHFNVDEAYGGGKSAPMDAEAQLHMACIPGLKAAYGGAEAANIEGNVTLNITNGNFDRVFGGNNISGTISGTITVNIEEIGCKPIIIGQLYGGGNLAAYTAPTDQHGPTVNVKSFTSIGEVYGGGYGTGAVVTGDTYVNINEVLGDKASDNQFMKEKVTTVEDPATQTTGDDKVSKNTGVTKTFKDGDGENANTISVEIPLHKSGKIGVINNVFGGGNAAEVNGNTNVNIGTVDKVYVVKSITAGTTFTPTDRYYTRNDDGTYTQATGTATSGTTYYEEKDIVGVDIRGNVYGGGNNAEVTGNTNVTIGKRAAQ